MYGGEVYIFKCNYISFLRNINYLKYSTSTSAKARYLENQRFVRYFNLKSEILRTL